MFTKGLLKPGVIPILQVLPQRMISNQAKVMISSAFSKNHNFVKVEPVSNNTNAWKRRFSANFGGTDSDSHRGRPENSFPGFNEESSSPPPSTFGYVHDQEGEEEFQFKLKVLAASLNHVNTLGWSRDALRAGASDLNLSESIASLCEPFDLVEYFQRTSNAQLEAHLISMEKQNKSLYSSLEYRLSLVIPFIDKYHQAMGLSLEPGNVPRSLEVLRELSDIVCINGLGDSSTDLRWYTKRTGIASIYVATECCMVQDKSDDFKETWQFLKRRVNDYQMVEGVGSAVLPVLETSAITLLNVLGMNKRR